MSENKQKMKLEDMRPEKVIVKITSYGKEPIANSLHPDYAHSFNSILGDIYSTGNGMRYLNSNVFKPKWLSSKITGFIYVKIKQGGNKSIPNYWDLVKFILVDRLLSDKKLLTSLYITYSTTINHTYFVPHIILNRGIIEEELPNDKLDIYGRILKQLIKYIFDATDESGLGSDYINIETDDYKNLKHTIKEDVFNYSLKRCKGRLADGVSDVTNEELRAKFLK